MRILLRLPNWLGDAVMITPAFELLKAKFPQASFSLVGPEVTCSLFKRDTKVKSIFIDETKKSKNRVIATYKLAKKIGKHDVGITFTNNIFSALMLFWSKTPIRIGYAKNLRSIFLTHKPLAKPNIHQVISYCNLLEPLFNKTFTTEEIPPLRLISQKNHSLPSSKIRIGINPGAAFGSAKRWLKEYFSEIILYLMQKDCEVFLYGNKSDEDSIEEIISIVKKLSPNQWVLENINNLAGKTTIASLIDNIASLDLFITNDSGPMHIASALQIPLIAIFGSTNDSETSPWKHPKAIILNKRLPCAPCKKRVCPLGHHNCMKLITPDEVIIEIKKLLTRINQ